MKVSVIGLLFLCGNLNLCCASKYVPVFMWSNDRNREFPHIFAGHFTSKFEFQSKYIPRIVENVLLFIQDKLSLSDILLHGSVYGESDTEKDFEHLKSIMMEYTSSFLPNVEHAALAISQIFEADDSFDVVKINANYLNKKENMHSLFSTSSNKNLFIIDFSHSDQSLETIDNLIGNVMSHFKLSNRIFTAYYTANENNEVDGSVEIPSSSGSRHLLATSADDEPKPIQSENFLFYFDELIVDRSRNLTIPFENVQVVKNDCDKYTNVTSSVNCTVKLKLGNADAYENMHLEFFFETSGAINSGYWYVSKAILSYTNSNSSLQGELVEASVGDKLLDPTPLGYSYSCYDQEPLHPSTSGNYTSKDVPALVFIGLQFEVFMSNQDKFGHYNDCVGFFTIGIWMFIICAAILITILLFGVSMLMSINTMDRYDDPKGKSIAIASGD